MTGVDHRPMRPHNLRGRPTPSDSELSPHEAATVLNDLGDALVRDLTVTSLVGTGTSGCIRFDDSHKYEPVEYEELQGNLADYYGEKIVTSGIFLAGDFEAYVSFDGEIHEYNNIWEMYPPGSDPDDEDEYIPVINHHPKEEFLAEKEVEMEIELISRNFTGIRRDTYSTIASEISRRTQECPPERPPYHE